MNELRRTVSKSPEEQFIEFANPHSWLRSADNLHNQAVALCAKFGKSLTTQVDYRIGVHKHRKLTPRFLID
jgi:hypothetical protein